MTKTKATLNRIPGAARIAALAVLGVAAAAAAIVWIIGCLFAGTVVIRVLPVLSRSLDNPEFRPVFLIALGWLLAPPAVVLSLARFARRQAQSKRGPQ